MLTQKQAIMCLEAIQCVVLTEKILHDGEEELVSDEEMNNWEINEEQSRGNFMALWSMLSEDERKALLEELRNTKD